MLVFGWLSASWSAGSAIGFLCIFLCGILIYNDSSRTQFFTDNQVVIKQLPHSSCCATDDMRSLSGVDKAFVIFFHGVHAPHNTGRGRNNQQRLPQMLNRAALAWPCRASRRGLSAAIPCPESLRFSAVAVESRNLQAIVTLAPLSGWTREPYLTERTGFDFGR